MKIFSLKIPPLKCAAPSTARTEPGDRVQLGESDQQRLRTFQRSAEFADWLVGPCVREAGA